MRSFLVDEVNKLMIPSKNGKRWWNAPTAYRFFTWINLFEADQLFFPFA